ncbi:hypothetical protein VULLAG_LOCUS22628 [Vulpes lagopus]
MRARRAEPPRARPRHRLLRLLLLTSAKPGTGPSGVVRVAEGGWAGGGEVRSAEPQPEPGPGIAFNPIWCVFGRK